MCSSPRSVSCDDHVIQEKMTSLRDNGFINYFGMQRFGTSTVPTYHIGRYCVCCCLLFTVVFVVCLLFTVVFVVIYCLLYTAVFVVVYCLLFTGVYCTQTGREQWMLYLLQDQEVHCTNTNTPDFNIVFISLAVVT